MGRRTEGQEVRQIGGRRRGRSRAALSHTSDVDAASIAAGAQSVPIDVTYDDEVQVKRIVWAGVSEDNGPIEATLVRTQDPVVVGDRLEAEKVIKRAYIPGANGAPLYVDFVTTIRVTQNAHIGIVHSNLGAATAVIDTSLVTLFRAI